MKEQRDRLVELVEHGVCSTSAQLGIEQLGTEVAAAPRRVPRHRVTGGLGQARETSA